MHLDQWHDAFASLLQGDAQPLGKFIQGTKAFPAQKRLNVYRNNYQQGVISHLALTFERCLVHVGKDYFSQLALSYLARYHPKTTTLENYGKDFPEHLAKIQTEHPELKKLPYLPDLAKLDWLCDQIYYSPAPSTWSQAAFNALTPEQQTDAQLKLSPNCRLLHSQWALSLLWELHAQQRDNVDMQQLDQSEYLLLNRLDYRIQPQKLSVDTYQLLEAIQAGNTIEQLSSDYSDTISQLPELIIKGWIHDFEVKGSHA